MPKVDLNPVQSGGTVEMFSTDFVRKALMLALSIGVVTSIYQASTATVTPVVNNVMEMLPFVTTQQGDSGAEWSGW